MTQRRADAAVLMAENSLQNAGRDMATADRYQVIVSVDSSELRQHRQSEQNQHTQTEPCEATRVEATPEKCPTIQGACPIASETARRIACDCSVSSVTHSDGEPINIGRKSRLWPPAMARANKHRDQHCQFPGCNQTRHLQIHHIQHWADGGSTCVENAVCVCAVHHTFVHEGGYRIERVNDKKNGPDEQFKRQQSTKHTLNDVETLLRNSRESFEFVRTLSPSRFRFRVVNQNGQDIRDVLDSQNAQQVFADSETDARTTRVKRSSYDQWIAEYEAATRTYPSGVAEHAGNYRVVETCL